jgi:hypothetical protein
MLRSQEQLEQSIQRLQMEVSTAQRTILALAERQASTEQALADVAAPTTGALVNLLPNADANFSKDAWVSGPPVVGGDISFEAYNWYRFLATDTALVEDAAHALKSVGHSLYAANEGANADIPIWDKVNGIIQLGSVTTNWMLATPFVKNDARPSGELQFQVICERLSALALPAGLGLVVAVHDNTVGQQKIIEGADEVLSGAPVGTAGATSTDYFLVAPTDFGQQYKSNVLTVATANATLNATNYVSLSWGRVPGVTSYDLYRARGGVIKLIAQIRNGATSYWDQGGEIQTVGAYPVVTLTKPRAYTEVPAARFDVSATEWRQYGASIVVPFNYNSALTTDKQWLIIRPTGLCAEARQLKLDHFGLGEQYGLWARSFYDAQAKNNVSTSAASSDQGNVGTSGGGGAVYGGGGRLNPLEL